MIQDILDRYALSARVAPALWVIVPSYVAALGIASKLRSAEASALLTLAAAVAAVFLADVVRDRGKAAEVELFRRWGGSPTTQRLRYSSERTTQEVAGLHEVVRNATNRLLPDEVEEAADPDRADNLYEQAVAILRERTRTGHPVVFAELAAYGRKRNTWAIRRIGRLTSVTGLLLCAGAVAYPPVRAAAGSEWLVTTAAAELFLTWYWFFEVREPWVKDAAERYADALFNAAASLGPLTGVAT